jgi:2C-methyl-D-erythritol 2,4-cyclodiphosphate synthase
MSLDEVKDAISSAVGTEDVGSVFDETVENYRKLVQRSEELIVRTLRLSVQQEEAVKFLERALSSRAFKGIRRQVALSSKDRDDFVSTPEEEETS